MAIAALILGAIGTATGVAGYFLNRVQVNVLRGQLHDSRRARLIAREVSRNETPTETSVRFELSNVGAATASKLFVQLENEHGAQCSSRIDNMAPLHPRESVTFDLTKSRAADATDQIQVAYLVAVWDDDEDGGHGPERLVQTSLRL